MHYRGGIILEMVDKTDTAIVEFRAEHNVDIGWLKGARK
jgi:hypothetical protein